MKNPKVSVIIPTYNEEKTIKYCLESLSKQSYKPLEIIVVDDGSTDKTLDVIKNFQFLVTKRQRDFFNSQLLRQKHLGPGPARNLGAVHAQGEILVFVDADMTFDKDFTGDLVDPIVGGKTIGTFSKNEMVANLDNIWPICWSLNRNVPKNRMLPKDYPNEAPVFRAILKKEFDRVGGFDATGEYTDDWSLSKKLKVKSSVVSGAIYYHSNPATLSEVWKQARWIGKNEFISGSFIRRLKSLIQYSLPISMLVGFIKSVINMRPEFLIFKLIYDLAIFTSALRSFTNESKAK